MPLNSTGCGVDSELPGPLSRCLGCPVRSKGGLSQGLSIAPHFCLDICLLSLLQDMKAQCVSLWLLGSMFSLWSVHARGLRRCLTSMDTHHVEETFREIRAALVSVGVWVRSRARGACLTSPPNSKHEFLLLLGGADVGCSSLGSALMCFSTAS